MPCGGRFKRQLKDKKEWNLAICNNMDGPRGYYGKWNKSYKDKYSYNLTDMWNLENKANKQTKQKQT